MSDNKERILIFDLLRIFSILLIIVWHAAPCFNLPSYVSDPRLIANILYLNPGMIGTISFVILSGMSLEYAHRGRFAEGLGAFYLKKILRIYPLFWISYTVVMAYIPNPSTLSEVILQYTGFYVYLSLDGVSRWGSPINPSIWFISLIVILYLLYPSLTGLVRKYPGVVLLSTGIIGFGLAWILNTYAIGANTAWWSPTSYLVWFSLGIFVVQRGMYPQTPCSSRVIKYLSDLSFPVFLIHQTLLIYASYNLAGGVAALLLFSAMLLALDERIQGLVKKVFISRPAPGRLRETQLSSALPK